MVFSPSLEVHDRMVSELAGVFIDRAFNPPPYLWLVAKLPMNLDPGNPARRGTVADGLDGAGRRAPCSGVRPAGLRPQPPRSRRSGPAAMTRKPRTSCRPGERDLSASNPQRELPAVFRRRMPVRSGAGERGRGVVTVASLPGEGGLKLRDARPERRRRGVLRGAQPEQASGRRATGPNHREGRGTANTRHRQRRPVARRQGRGRGTRATDLSGSRRIFPYGAFHSPKVGEGTRRPPAHRVGVHPGLAGRHLLHLDAGRLRDEVRLLPDGQDGPDAEPHGRRRSSARCGRSPRASACSTPASTSC